MNEALPVTIVTGFLGAGKTTLVNYWLAKGERGDIAVIVNEQGDIGVDGELLAERARTLIEVTGGCVCCTTQAELVNALDSIAEAHPRPSRVLVETSGAASPAGVVRAIVAGGKTGALTLDGIVTVFDATRIEAVLEHDLAREQLGFADVVVLSRADACEPELVTSAVNTLTRYNGATVFAASKRGEVTSSGARTLEELLQLRRKGFAASVTPLVRASHVYESVSLCCDGALDGERFEEFVEAELAVFSGRIFRIKGIFAVSGLDVRLVVQGVAESVEVTLGEPWGEAQRKSRLVVVGFGLERDRLVRGFEDCRVPA